MTLEQTLRLTNKVMIGFDLILGCATLIAPGAGAHPRARLRLAGRFNLAAALGFGRLAKGR